jgi:hypothetical protein
MSQNQPHYSAEKQYSAEEIEAIKAHLQRQLAIAAAYKDGRRISRR